MLERVSMHPECTFGNASIVVEQNVAYLHVLTQATDCAGCTKEVIAGPLHEWTLKCAQACLQSPFQHRGAYLTPTPCSTVKAGCMAAQCLQVRPGC